MANSNPNAGPVLLFGIVCVSLGVMGACSKDEIPPVQAPPAPVVQYTTPTWTPPVEAPSPVKVPDVDVPNPDYHGPHVGIRNCVGKGIFHVCI